MPQIGLTRYSQCRLVCNTTLDEISEGAAKPCDGITRHVLLGEDRDKLRYPAFVTLTNERARKKTDHR